MLKFFEFFSGFYHKFLHLFFDFDVNVYEITSSQVFVKKLHAYKYKNLNNINIRKYQDPELSFYYAPIQFLSIPLRKLKQELYFPIKFKNIILKFFCINKNHNLNVENNLNISIEDLNFNTNLNKATNNDIHISNKLRTINELLEFEPYVKEIPKEQLADIPVRKYPVKFENFTKKQIDIMKKFLAQEAGCKEYNMSLENIYDNLPVGLYSDIKINKDDTIICIFNKTPYIGENQLLLVGRRNYDVNITKKIIKYSEIGL